LRFKYRGKMKEKKAILLVGTADTEVNIQYATGFHAVDPVVCLCCGKKKWLVVPAMEKLRAMSESLSHNVKVLTPSDLKFSTKNKGRLIQWTEGLLNFAGISSVVIPPFFPAGLAFELKKKFRVQVAETQLFSDREIKTSEEIKHIIKAQQAACIAMENAVKIIAGAKIKKSFLWEGNRKLTSERVREIIFQTIFGYGCIAKDVIVAGGYQAADPHCSGSGPLKAGKTIVIDIFPRHRESGYWGDLTRTVVRGTPSDKWQKIYDIVLEAQKNALAKVKPGNTLGAPHMAAEETFKKYNMKTDFAGEKPKGFVHGTGHGVGLEIHEAPSLFGSDKKIRAGNVFTVEPGWYEPGEGGVRIEDTVLVTNTGWRFMATCKKQFCV